MTNALRTQWMPPATELHPLHVGRWAVSLISPRYLYTLVSKAVPAIGSVLHICVLHVTQQLLVCVEDSGPGWLTNVWQRAFHGSTVPRFQFLYGRVSAHAQGPVQVRDYNQEAWLTAVFATTTHVLAHSGVLFSGRRMHCVPYHILKPRHQRTFDPRGWKLGSVTRMRISWNLNLQISYRAITLARLISLNYQ